MLLDRHHHLDDGRRVRLRLPHVGDARPLRRVLARLGLGTEELALRRALRAPVAVCATAFDGSSEALLGFARVEPSGRETVLAVDDAVAALLRAGLAERVDARRVA